MPSCRGFAGCQQYRRSLKGLGVHPHLVNASLVSEVIFQFQFKEKSDLLDVLLEGRTEHRQTITAGFFYDTLVMSQTLVTNSCKDLKNARMWTCIKMSIHMDKL